MNKKKILVTTALPYANGSIHLGHLLETIQADIWVRFQRMRGHECHFISGSDAHGTSIMLSAEKAGIAPEQHIEHIREQHRQDFDAFLINFDNFYTTHSDDNKILSSQIFERLKTRGDIKTRHISQAFDSEKKLFLADRFIKGQCPRCHTHDQYGDHCEACGATYEPTELQDPYSVLSGTKPIEKESLHYFFQLNHYESLLKKWINPKHLQPQVIHKLQEWFDVGLKDWDISRDAPYFGFEIPNAPGKYFYVWLDAPIGYMASFKNLCEQRDGLDFNTYWNKNSDTELYHFIGKDIIYFHALFWPALLHGSGYRMPTSIYAHGFLTVNGQKMSKSRGTFITAQQYAQQMKPEFLRYYFAAKLAGQLDDIDLNAEDFKARINADLIGKYVNLASRCAGFIKKQFNNRLADTLHDDTLFQEFVIKGACIAESFQTLNTNQAVREIMTLADHANQYIAHHQPWALAKQKHHHKKVQQICTQGINLFRLLTLYLKPILPSTAKAVEDFLNIPPLQWCDHNKALLDHDIQPFKPLMQRITPEELAVLGQ